MAQGTGLGKGVVYRPYGGAKELIEARDPEVLLGGPAGTGKAHPVSELVVTPGGLVPVGSLAIGDVVCTPDGDTARVTAVHPQGVRDIYRVRFSCGRVVRATADHLWAVRRLAGKTGKGAGIRPESFTLTTAQIATGLTRCQKAPRRRWWVEPPAPAGMAARPVPVPAYLFGAWLGDGSPVGLPGRGGLEVTTADHEIIEAIRAGLGDRYTIRQNAPLRYRVVAGWRDTPAKRVARPYLRLEHGKYRLRVRVPGATRYVGSFVTRAEAMAAFREQPECHREVALPYHRHVAALGLGGCRAHEKFVPDVYKFNAEDVRRAVVQGLMDTDGTVDRKTGVPSFCTTSRRLARDFRFLVESLGGGVTIRAKRTAHRVAFICHVRHDDPATLFRLTRKKVLCRARTKYPFRRWVEAVTPEGREEARCITIDHPERLYLARGCVPTHNSIACLTKLYLAAFKYPGMRALIVRKTRESLTEAALVTWEEKVVPEGHPMLVGPQRRLRQSYHYGNGSEIITGGLDKPQKVMSTEYDLIFVQEAIELTEVDWSSLLSRLRHGVMPYQQLLADTNPSAPSHWLKKRCDEGKTRLIHGRHEDNPVLFDPATGLVTPVGESYLAKLDSLPKLLRDRLRFGKWVQAEGAVYEEWDAQVHVVDPFPVPPEWTRYLSVDFGFVNPLVCFDGETEILTPAGWRRFEALAADEQVATINPATRSLEWQLPVARIKTWHDGPLVVSEGSGRCGVNFAVTPDHRMVVKNRKSGRWRLEPASRLKHLGDSAIPTAWEPIRHDDGNSPVELTHRTERGMVSRVSTSRKNFAEFLGFWIAEGCLVEQVVKASGHVRRYVRLAQKKFADDARRILGSLGVRWTEYIKPDGVIDFRVQNAALYYELFRLCGKVGSRDKRIPGEVLNWGADSLRSLLGGLMLGDGCGARQDARGVHTRTATYHTSSSGLADDVQAVACRLGIASAVSSKWAVTSRCPAGLTMYRVRFHRYRHAVIGTLHLREEPYSGFVHCVTVPNGMLVVRRKGRPMVCGNCQFWAADPDGRLYLYREIYKTKTLVEDAARMVAEARAEELSEAQDFVLARAARDGVTGPALRAALDALPDQLRPAAILCDHDAEDRKTLERHLGLPTRAADKAVAAGIQAVAERLRVLKDGRPRLAVFRDARRHPADPDLLAAAKPTRTAEEMEAYAWADHKTKEQPAKENDHGCFAAGTPVRTDRGLVPVETVRAGDRVATHLGFARVAAAGSTGFREVVRVTLADGRSILCTPDHPLAASGGGWVAAGESLGRWVDTEGEEWKSSDTSPAAGGSASGCPGAGSGGTATPTTGRIAISAGRSGPAGPGGGSSTTGSTRKSGSPPTAPSPTGWWFTTATRTWPTTTPVTWNGLPRPGTPNSTGRTWNWPAPPPRGGTAPRTAARGTASTPPESPPTDNRPPAGATAAATSTRRKRSAGPASAPAGAAPPPAGPPGWTTRTAFARLAASLSARTATNRRGAARRNVRPTCVVAVEPLPGRREVFNLATADGTYFAGGVLVSNCDALRYMAAHLAGRRPLVGFAV